MLFFTQKVVQLIPKPIWQACQVQITKQMVPKTLFLIKSSTYGFPVTDLVITYLGHKTFKPVEKLFIHVYLYSSVQNKIDMQPLYAVLAHDTTGRHGVWTPGHNMITYLFKISRTILDYVYIDNYIKLTIFACRICFTFFESLDKTLLILNFCLDFKFIFLFLEDLKEPSRICLYFWRHT